MTYNPPGQFEGNDEPFTKETAERAMREIMQHASDYLGEQATDVQPYPKVDTFVESPYPLFPEDPTFVVVNVTVRFGAAVIYGAYNHDEVEDNIFFARDEHDENLIETVLRAEAYKPSDVPRLKAHLTHLLDEHFDDE